MDKNFKLISKKIDVLYYFACYRGKKKNNVMCETHKSIFWNFTFFEIMRFRLTPFNLGIIPYLYRRYNISMMFSCVKKSPRGRGGNPSYRLLSGSICEFDYLIFPPTTLQGTLPLPFSLPFRLRIFFARLLSFPMSFRIFFFPPTAASYN